MLRQFRTEAGVTLDAAEALEYSRQRIWRIERASRNQRPARWSGVTYRSTAYTSLLPWQVRGRRFKLVGLGRRGPDPSEVYAFLDPVAGETLPEGGAQVGADAVH